MHVKVAVKRGTRAWSIRSARSDVVIDPAWRRLRTAATELRRTQSPDGSVDTTEHDPEALRRRVIAITESAQALKPHLTQEQEYIDALCDEIVVWADAGYPAGDGLIEAFRLLPEGEPSERTMEAPADVAPHEVERSLKHGAIWALGTQFGAQAIRFAGVIVLARLLTPSDYGAAALAVAIASYSMLLGDLGYGGALIQAESAPRRWASTAFWCALAAGGIGTLGVALGAYPFALALGDPEVALLAIAGGLTLLLVGAGSASTALLLGRCASTSSRARA